MQLIFIYSCFYVRLAILTRYCDQYYVIVTSLSVSQLLSPTLLQQESGYRYITTKVIIATHNYWKLAVLISKVSNITNKQVEFIIKHTSITPCITISCLGSGSSGTKIKIIFIKKFDVTFPVRAPLYMEIGQSVPDNPFVKTTEATTLLLLYNHHTSSTWPLHSPFYPWLHQKNLIQFNVHQGQTVILPQNACSL